MKSLISFELIVGLILILLLVFIVIFGPLLTSHGPNDVHLEMKNQGPSGHHYLGTDHMGRCVFTRMVYGSRYSVGISLLTLTGTFVLSVLYGFLAGYTGGKLDVFLSGICDLAMAFPPMVIVLSLMGLFATSIKGLIIAIMIASWPWYAKIIRSVVIVEKNKSYVTAALISGSGHYKIIYKHILPNILNTIVVMYFTGISNMILMVSGFSYLGIGFSSEIPEWGAMLSSAKSYIFTRPELLMIPGFCIFVTSLGFNLIGESLRNGEG
ncbi:ABC transporter permease subunit [Acidaminobacter sp. JC074]|uniref:ABC transporter permease n=1 Tax=Acidaminobacter sp. JC074 TaxID=2530199 RepID=UPI001F10FA8F|nr:ABC transporter permease subunit [Acidaminobacter sp. JC074]MCH4891036.1 ABC transporter permease subunit [Acidaminobacter sp. JC074]